MRVSNHKETIVVGAGMFGLVLMAGAAPSLINPTSSAGEPCCAIASVDAAKQTVMVKTSDGKHSFAMKLADATSVRMLRPGTPVSFSNEALSLWAGSRAIKLQSITYVPATTTGSGVVANPVSSPGKWILRAPRGGRCPPNKTVITETGSVDCVLTHDRTAEGKGCEYFCI